MPGFVDTHRHAWKSLLRNRGPSDTSGGEPVADYGPDDVYAATLIGLLGAIEAGITTVVDWSDVSSDPAHVDAALAAHSDSELRTVYVHAPGRGGHEEAKAGLRRLAARGARQSSPLTTIAYGPPEPERSDLDRTVRDWGLARELGFRIHTHITADQSGVISELAGRGLLGDDVTLIHCSGVNRADIEAIATHDVRVSLAPSREMADGLGLPPIQELMDHRIRPGLGVDNEATVPGDIFAQMRAANSIQHATLFDKKLAGKGGLPNLLSTRDVIRFASIDGARAVGLGDVTGSIEVGKRADVILLRTDRPNIHPINDPIGAVVWGMDTSNLDWVFVDGEAQMREGELVTDVVAARKIALEAQQRVAVAAGGTG